MARPRRPLTCWETLPGLGHCMVGRRNRVKVIDRDGVREPTSSTLSGTLPRGRWRRPARPAATPAGGRRASPRRPMVPVVHDPQDLAGVQIHDGVIHGSCRIHELQSGSRQDRTDWNQCSSMPSILGLSVSTSGRVRTQALFSAALTIHQGTANAVAGSDTARPGECQSGRRMTDSGNQLVREPRSALKPCHSLAQANAPRTARCYS